jgi:hypothetical protein
VAGEGRAQQPAGHLGEPAGAVNGKKGGAADPFKKAAGCFSLTRVAAGSWHEAGYGDGGSPSLKLVAIRWYIWHKSTT